MAELIEHCTLAFGWAPTWSIFIPRTKKSCFFRVKWRFRPKMALLGGAGICPKIPKKGRLLALKMIPSRCYLLKSSYEGVFVSHVSQGTKITP